jgi:multiple sugar transport system substrate-binding protein
MTIPTLDRRSFLKHGMAGGATALAAGALPLLAGGPARAADTNLRVYWWGSQDRARRTMAVGDLFHERNPSVTVTGEVTGGDYWQKLATQMVGRNMPDVFQLEPNTLADYSRRGATRPLDPFMPKPLDIDGFGKGMVDLCRVDGKVFGVALGLNSFAMIYDQDAFEKASIKPPTIGTTWKEYADLAVELTKAAGRPGYFGAPYGARYHYVFEIWLRQRGKGLYSPEGKIGFTVDDAKEWYSYWEDLRARGGCVTADIQALDELLIDSNALATGKSATGLVFSNQLIGYQLLTKSKLGLTTVPFAGPGMPSGHYYRPALIWGIGATSKNPEIAAAYINFFVNDPKAGELLGVERGVPMSQSIREAILPSLNEVEKATVKYVNTLADKVIPYPPPAPKGSTEFDHTAMRPTADQLAFGKLTVAQAAQRLYDEGNRIL